MRRHPEQTDGRIRQFIERELRSRAISAHRPLRTEFAPGAFPDAAAADAEGDWREVEPGFRWGPAYAEGWYRTRLKVPKDWEPGEAALGCGVASYAFTREGMIEGTVWRGNRPVGGIDFGHSHWRLAEDIRGGALHLQTYAHNTECRVHGEIEPRRPEPEEFPGLHLARLDPERIALLHDAEFALGLMETLPETDPMQAALRRALNDVCNLAAARPDRFVAAARRRLREAMKDLGGELDHAVTPVGHAHLDTAWLWPLEVTRLKMAHTTAVQLDLMERYPEHLFVHSQASQYEWLQERQPELLERVKNAIRRGQWEAVGSMWVEADCNLASGESLVRQILYGRRWFKEHLGVETTDLWLPDVFGYSAALPQILRKFGIEAFLTQKMSWSQTNKIPANTFWWQGIDGSQVWTHFPPGDTYIADCSPKQLIESVQKHRDHARSDESLMPYGHGDGGGGPSEWHLERLRRARQAPGVPMVERRRSAATFFREAREASQDLSVWSGELYLEMHRGTYTSQAAMKRENRRAEFRLRDAEWLAASAAQEYPSEELEQAWKLVLLNQFHDIIPGSSVAEVYGDAHRDYAKAKDLAEGVIDRSLEGLGRSLDTVGMEKPISLFQNSPAAGECRIAWEEENAPQAIRCGDEVLPCQLVEAFGERDLIFESPLACLGAVAAADLQPEAAIGSRLKVSRRRMENDELSVRFDANGNITSIRTLDGDPVELVAPDSLANMFQIFEDRPLFWDAWDIDSFALETGQDLPRAESVQVVEQGPVRVAIEVVRRVGDSKITQRISLGPTPGIRFDTEVDWQESHKLLKVAFPLNLIAPRATFEIQCGHVERPIHRNTSWDEARFEVCHQKWMDLSEEGHGVALVNDGKYGCDVEGSTMRLSLLRSPTAPDPDCDRGIHRFSYALIPHYDSLIHSDVIEAAYAFNAPVRWRELPAQVRGEAALPSAAKIDTPNLMLEAVKKAEDSERRVIRLYECRHSRGTARLSLDRTPKKAWIADLNEEPKEALEIQDGDIILTYKPFEIITVLAEV